MSGVRRVLITGIGGQDGSLLAELLLDKGYAVSGVARTLGPHRNLAAIQNSVEVFDSDLTDQRAVAALLERCQPEEVYNLASVSFAPASWEEPVATVQAGALAVAVLVEAVRTMSPEIRYSRLRRASSSVVLLKRRRTRTPH